MIPVDRNGHVTFGFIDRLRFNYVASSHGAGDFLIFSQAAMKLSDPTSTPTQQGLFNDHTLLNRDPNRVQFRNHNPPLLPASWESGRCMGFDIPSSFRRIFSASSYEEKKPEPSHPSHFQ